MKEPKPGFHNWTIKSFPTKTRKQFVRTAKAIDVTVAELLTALVIVDAAKKFWREHPSG